LLIKFCNHKRAHDYNELYVSTLARLVLNKTLNEKSYYNYYADIYSSLNTGLL